MTTFHSILTEDTLAKIRSEREAIAASLNDDSLSLFDRHRLLFELRGLETQEVRASNNQAITEKQEATIKVSLKQQAKYLDAFTERSNEIHALPDNPLSMHIKYLFWHSVDVLRMSGVSFSLGNIRNLIVTAAKDENQLLDGNWQQKSYCFKVLDLIDAVHKLGALPKAKVDPLMEFWLDCFPNPAYWEIEGMKEYEARQQAINFITNGV